MKKPKWEPETTTPLHLAVSKGRKVAYALLGLPQVKPMLLKDSWLFADLLMLARLYNHEKLLKYLLDLMR